MARSLPDSRRQWRKHCASSHSDFCKSAHHLHNFGRQMQKLGQKLITCKKNWRWRMRDAHLAEKEQTLIPIHPQHQQRQTTNQQVEGRKNSFLSRSKDWIGGITESHGGTCRPASSSSSSTSQWSTSQGQMRWSSWQPTSSEQMVWISVSWKEFQKIDRVCRQYTYSQKGPRSLTWWGWPLL